MKKIIDFFWNKEFIFFVIIGVINTFNGTVFSFLYSLFMNANVAFIIGYISGLIISYLLNSYFTFKETLRISKFVKFGISYIPNFIIQNIIVYIVYNILDMNKLIAFGLAALIGVPITFICMKLFAFKDKSETKDRR